jgi:eukaryotic-like serine/threonine-protein kinase
MKRIFHIVLGALAMLVVALTSAFLAMRLAIHGREVAVPNLAGLTISEASQQASSVGLSLNLENRFYSANIPAGRILAQSPAPGLTVRRDWAIRITESLGAQQVSIPDVIGQSERTASINVRRLGLDLGTISHIPTPGEPGIVIAQTPNPNTNAAQGPRVSLLVSAPEPTDAPEPTPVAAANAYVMPALTGLTLATASARVNPIGMHLVEDVNAFDPSAPTPSTPPSAATIIAQTPPAGHRVFKGQSAHITLNN